MLCLLAAVAGALAWRIYGNDSPAGSPGAWVSPAPMERLETKTIPPEVWDVFKAGPSRMTPDEGMASRFRLAGTFFMMGSVDAEGEGQRLAIIDDLGASKQHIVSEGEDFEGHEVLRIYQDRLILRKDGEEIELTLGFRDGRSPEDGGKTDDGSDAGGEAEEAALETNRFGKRVGETRWVMEKKALVDYYHELLDEPERIAAIYESLKPDYNETGDIRGYYLEKEGEADFFDAVGLREGDKIRKVNSMNMISQGRAEYFIGEFMQDRLGAVVIDIEREGKEEKLIYLLR